MTYFRMITSLLLTLVSILLSVTMVMAAEKRVALIVGNGAYSNAPELANPVADARAMSQKLRLMGFDIVEGYDLDKTGLEQTVREFSNRSKDADLSLFFYAGHGIAVENKNYLIPVDARFEDSSALDFEAIPVNLVTRQMQYSQGVSLVFLDACRDNPLARTLSRSMGSTTRSSGIGSGLAAMKISNPGKGLAIAFATSPGAVAYDGAGKHSPFTGALLKHIDQPNTDITEIMSRVTGEVVKSTNQKQRPWLNTSLTGSVILNRVEQVTAGQQIASLDLGQKRPVVSSSDTLERQKVLYNLARETGHADDYRAYLETFPNGLFSANARRSLERLDSRSQKRGSTLEYAKLGEVDEAPLKIKPAEIVKIKTVVNTEPLELTAGATAKDQPANSQTEATLDMDAQKRVEVQKRLTVAGFNPGVADGIFGNGTRSALRKWQDKNAFDTSGYLNEPQLQMLMQQTEDQLASYEPPVVKKAIKKRTSVKRTKKAVVRSVKPKPRKKTVKKPAAMKKKKRVVKRKTVRKPKRVAKREVRRTRRTADRRRYRNEGYQGYLDRRRRNRDNGSAIIGGAILGGAIGIAIGRKRKH